MHKCTLLLRVSLAAIALCGLGCGSKTHLIAGTSIPDEPGNRDIVKAVEQYRLAVEARDAGALLLMASAQYWEDAGTPAGSDDYGYKDLREVLSGRFQKAEDVRYSVRYMGIQRRCPDDADGNAGCRAYVDVLVDASFSVLDARGKSVRRDKRDQNQFVLEWSDDRWKFLSGM